jgi:hypothetical protein
LVEVAVDEPFAALAQCEEWNWEPHPAPPAVPTHLRCLYAWPELLFNACCHSDEQAYLDAAPMASCTLPAEFGEIWTALLETTLVPLDRPITKTAVLLKLFIKVASSISGDPRLSLTVAKTCSDWGNTCCSMANAVQMQALESVAVGVIVGASVASVEV